MTLLPSVEVSAEEKVGAAPSIVVLTIEMLSTSVPLYPPLFEVVAWMV